MTKVVPLIAPAPRLVELAEGVAAYVQPDGSCGLNNSGLVTGGGQTLLVDTAATERRTRRLLDTVAAWTDSPIRLLVNTHHHRGHTFGNRLVHGAVVVGHPDTRAAMAGGGPSDASRSSGVDFSPLEPDPPAITVASHIRVHVGEIEVEVRWAGHRAHTSGDLVVWLPASGVLFTGDLVFAGAHTFLPDGSLPGLIAALRELTRLEPRSVVPGHGEPGGPELLVAALSYAEWVWQFSEWTYARYLDPVTAARHAVASTEFVPFAGLALPERLVANLARAHIERTGAGWSPPELTPEVIRPLMAEFTGTGIRLESWI